MSGFEGSIHVGHSCVCGYYTADKSNYNKHVKRCKWHLQSASVGPGVSTLPKPKSPSMAQTQAKTSSTPTKGKLYMCEACGKSYKSKYGLKLHIKSKHEKTFKHRCSVCNKAFNQTVQYRYHCLKHLNVAMDKCPHCELSFSSQGSLRRHLKTCKNNTEFYERFKCDLCNASFPHKHTLRYHQRGKHQPNRYACQGCSKVFAWRSSLNVHKKYCKSAWE